MKLNRLKLNSTLIVLIITSILSACSKKDTLKPLEKLYLYNHDIAYLEATYCTQKPDLIRQKVKTLIIMDKSSSMQNPPDATDPNGMRRYYPLTNFVSNATPELGFTYFALINFSDTATVVQDFTDDLTMFNNKVFSEWNKLGPQIPDDHGYTNYISAIDSAFTLIKTDIDKDRNNYNAQIVSSIYNIVFISDGQPYVASSTNANGLILQVFNPEIQNKLNQINALKNDRIYKPYIDDIKFNTAYVFSNRDTEAQNLLNQMADYANGQFFQFASGLNIEYNLFAIPAKKVKRQIKDIIVDNKNIIWWDDGRLLRDTDGDGLPDEIEKQLGSTLDLYDTDGNGVGDGIEYRTKGKPCKDVNCSRSVSARDNYAACTGMMPLKNPDGSANPTPDGVNPNPYGTVYFGDQNRDGINDCEAYLLHAQKDYFDANENGLPDILELKNQMSFVPPANLAHSDTDSDTFDNYKEIKQGSPTFISNERLVDFKPQTYNMFRTDNKISGTECYKLIMNTLNVIGWDNTIRVYLVENSAVSDSKPILRIAQKSLVGGSTSINFVDEDFK